MKQIVFYTHKKMWLEVGLIYALGFSKSHILR